LPVLSVLNIHPRPHQLRQHERGEAPPSRRAARNHHPHGVADAKPQDCRSQLLNAVDRGAVDGQHCVAGVESRPCPRAVAFEDAQQWMACPIGQPAEDPEIGPRRAIRCRVRDRVDSDLDASQREIVVEVEHVGRSHVAFEEIVRAAAAHRVHHLLDAGAGVAGAAAEPRHHCPHHVIQRTAPSGGIPDEQLQHHRNKLALDVDAGVVVAVFHHARRIGNETGLLGRKKPVAGVGQVGRDA
jgi:hypothetical protein